MGQTQNIPDKNLSVQSGNDNKPDTLSIKQIVHNALSLSYARECDHL